MRAPAIRLLVVHANPGEAVTRIDAGAAQAAADANPVIVPVVVPVTTACGVPSVPCMTSAAPAAAAERAGRMQAMQ